MGFVQSPNPVHLQTCSEIAKMNITMGKGILLFFLDYQRLSRPK